MVNFFDTFEEIFLQIEKKKNVITKQNKMLKIIRKKYFVKCTEVLLIIIENVKDSDEFTENFYLTTKIRQSYKIY